MIALVRTLVLASVVAAAAAQSPAAKPSFLFLFADDFTYEAIRAWGHTDIDTPNLDRLAARGTTFTHAYNMGSYSPAVCIASRTMLVTGRHVWDPQGQPATVDQERRAGNLWPQLLASAGYRTYFTGKWHVQTDVASAFDVVRHLRPGMPRDVPAGYNRPLPGQPDPWDPADPKFGGFWEGGRHWSEVTADDAVHFLQEAGRARDPFFLYVAFNAPHDPRQSPAEYLSRYPTSRIQVPANFQPEYPHAEGIGAGPSLRDERLGPFPRTREAVQVQRREYYAIITHLDAQIGRVLDALEASGKADDTWIFFTADHGLAVGHHGLLGKQNMYDHSVRVPFIVRGPGVQAGRRLGTPIYLQDVMPTTLELAGVPRPAHVFFHSLLPHLRSAESAPASKYAAIYGAYLQLQRAVTQDGYKLIHYPKLGVVRLYNLREDPQETRDLAAAPAEQARKQRLFAALGELQRSLGDPLAN